MGLFLWILLIALGGTLLILGTLPIGRFPNFASEAALLRSPYGRILGGAILLFVILVLGYHPKSIALIILSGALVLVALVCLVFSLSEKVK